MAVLSPSTTEFISWTWVTVSLASCCPVPIQTSWVTREEQTVLGKQELRSVQREYLPHCRNNAEKLLPRAKFHWNRPIGAGCCHLVNSLSWFWLLVYGQKTIFNMASVRHLEFNFFYILSRDCHRVPNYLLLFTKFHQNRIILRWDIVIWWFSRWQMSAILNFRGQKWVLWTAYVGLPIDRQ